jgi:hypothetical protein
MRDAHIPFVSLWAYRSPSKSLLDPDQMKHLYTCNECLADLGICQRSQKFEDALQRKADRRGEAGIPEET